MTIYIGTRIGQDLYVFVERNGDEFPLEHTVLHSPDGFECGYGGSGPADLAFALLFDVAREIFEASNNKPTARDKARSLASNYYHDFLTEKVALLPRDEDWTITSGAVSDWLSFQPVDLLPPVQ